MSADSWLSRKCPKETEMAPKDNIKVAYLCDRKACETCLGECRHTQDITHAASFVELAPGRWIENLSEEKIDYKKLLEKYIDHVGQCEGTTFLYNHQHLYDSDLTKEEFEILRRIDNAVDEKEDNDD